MALDRMKIYHILSAKSMQGHNAAQALHTAATAASFLLFGRLAGDDIEDYVLHANDNIQAVVAPLCPTASSLVVLCHSKNGFKHELTNLSARCTLCTCCLDWQ